MALVREADLERLPQLRRITEMQARPTGRSASASEPRSARRCWLSWANLILAAGTPGLVNICPGFGPRAGGGWCAIRGFDRIVFNGSTAVGVEVAAPENVTPVALELGGKSPNIVCADADLELAAAAARRRSSSTPARSARPAHA